MLTGMALTPQQHNCTGGGSRMKSAIIVDLGPGQFALEYDDTVGRRNHMRLDAATYEKALREARSYLGINEEDQDEAGDQWAVV